MSEMISVASGFQYSVNIGYDLNNDDKLKNFIPTKAAMALLEDILLSTSSTSNERARVLIGAYGKGKSHIVLTILAMLMKKDRSLFTKTMPKIAENEKLMQLVENYYESENKILPVIISGSNTSLTQAFLVALHSTLSENNLLNVMPETNYKAAIRVIQRWEKDFPDTYQQLANSIDVPVANFIAALEDYNVETYEKFERIYPTLTAGSTFNSFEGFDVVELYDEAIRGIKQHGYSGIYVVYDEFSKYLEANITEASVSDTKMLQDFAEKCNRSGNEQLHLLLISHKEIANYIDKLPKQKVDGWRGVSERFKHVHLNDTFTQTYEIIASVIQKDATRWGRFCTDFVQTFNSIETRYAKHPIFSDIAVDDVSTTLYGCYPMHPVSTFILPRLSERVAQNERTLFTFISAPGQSTLPDFLDRYKDDCFEVITPDQIYDYFEPLFRKEVNSAEVHQNYVLAEQILQRLDKNSLEEKIVKTLALIYILEQFEKLEPTKEEIIGIYSISYEQSVIENAIKNLIENKFVVYLKRSNAYLKLKESSNVNIREKIQDMMIKQSRRVTTKDILNHCNFDSYVYPSRYNNDRDMVRFFSFEFISADEVKTDTDWALKSADIDADGVIYGIIPNNEDTLVSLEQMLIETSAGHERIIFVFPKHYHEIDGIVNEFNAVKVLKDSVANDKVLFDEYEVIYEDLYDVITSFIRSYTQPELFKSRYIYNGSDVFFNRKAALSNMLSTICENVYYRTPVINNEAINKNELTATAYNSRNKIVSALLRNELEPNLGLSGSGQEVSIMRSTLIRTGVFEEINGMPQINLHPDRIVHMDDVLSEIEGFIIDARQQEKVSFEELYSRLTSPENHIGLRKGLIPIYIAAVLHEYKREVIISDKSGQIPLGADVLLQINSRPEKFFMSYLVWNPEKEALVQNLEMLFQEYVIDAEKAVNSYDYVVTAMKRWYLSLPKYSRDTKTGPSGNKDRILKGYQKALSLLKQNLSGNEILFEKLPSAFGYDGFNENLYDNIVATKAFYDGFLNQVKNELIKELKETFILPDNKDSLRKMSLASIIKDWCDSLEPSVFEQLFTDGTDKCLGLFKSITNDDGRTVSRLAKLATDLRIEDWDEKTRTRFTDKIQMYKKTAENHKREDSDGTDASETNKYLVSYTDESGNTVTKRFDRIEQSKRGKLLFNSITSEIESMGRSISDQEKRQILMDILRTLC